MINALKFESTIFNDLTPEEKRKLETKKKYFFHEKERTSSTKGYLPHRGYYLLEWVCKIAKISVDDRE